MARSSDLFAATGTLTKPPAARTEVVHDTYFGETVDDPYRWMENDKDPAWLPFSKPKMITPAPCWISCRGATLF